MELRRYFRALRRWLWVLVACPVVAALVAGLVSTRLAPIYEAQVSVLVRPAQPLAVDPGVAALTSDQISRTYAQLMVQRPLMEQVISDLKLETTPERLAQEIKVTPQPNTTILDVTVDSTDRTLARDIANTLVDDFVDQIKSIQQQEQTSQQNARSEDNLVVISPAVLPSAPVSPNIPRNIVLAFAAGLLVAFGVVLLMEYLDQTIRSDEDLEERAGLVAIGHVGFVAAERASRRSELVILSPRSAIAEGYRSLRTNILYANVDRATKVLVITSPMPGEGKSRTAANLSVALSQSGHKVALLDADSRRPSQRKIFGRVRNTGLANLMIQDLPEDEIVAPVEGIPNLWLVCSGPTPPNPSELLGSRRMGAILDHFRQRFDYIIIDTPPVNAVTDATVVANFADASLLVVEYGKTSYRAAQLARQALDRVGARILGAVVNKLKASHDGYYEYYYQDYYGEPGDGQSKRRREAQAAPEDVRVAAKAE